MPFKFFRKAFGIKKNVEEKESEEFYKFYRNWHVADLNFDGFKKSCVRLLLLSLSPNEKLFDSDRHQDVKDNANPQEYSIYYDIGQNISPYRNSQENISALRIHNFKHKNLIVFSRNIKLFYNKIKDSKEYFPKATTRQVRHHAESSKNLMIALIFNLNWINELRQRSIDQYGKPSVYINESNHKGFNRLACFIYEHYLEIGILFSSNVHSILDTILRLEDYSNYVLQEGNPSRQKPLISREDFSVEVSRIFERLQNSVFELFQPRLYKSVWIHLSQTLTKVKRFDLELFKDLDNHFGSNGFSDHQLNPYDYLTNQFVKGCLNSLLKKAISKDKGLFLSKILTAILMQHQGWISSVLCEKENSNSFLQPEYDSNLKKFVQKIKQNQLLTQNLQSISCSPVHLFELLQRHQRNRFIKKSQSTWTVNYKPTSSDQSLQNPGNTDCSVGIPASIFSNSIITGQNKETNLSIFYLLTYFLRYPTFNKKSETLPDLGRADLFELEQKKKFSFNDSGNLGRRKSGSSVHLMNLNHIHDPSSSTSSSSTRIADSRPYPYSQSCCCSPGRYGDSGISSQEDLSSYLQKNNTSSSPIHSVSSSKLCLPQRLTTDQCRLAETAAQLVVNSQMTVQNVNKTLSSEISNITPSPGVSHHYNTVGSTAVNSSMKHNLFILSNQMAMLNHSSGASSGNLRNGVGLTSKKKDFLEIPLLIENYCEKIMNESCFCFPEDLQSGSDTSSTSVENSPCTVNDYDSSTNSIWPSNPSSLANHQALIDEFLSDLTPCHSFISSGLKEKYNRGVALQATSESFESFLDRLKSELTDWCTCGPSIIANNYIETSRIQSQHPLASHESFESTEDIPDSASISQNSSSNLSFQQSQESLNFNGTGITYNNPNNILSNNYEQNSQQSQLASSSSPPRDIIQQSLNVNANISSLIVGNESAVLARSLLINTDNRNVSVYTMVNHSQITTNNSTTTNTTSANFRANSSNNSNGELSKNTNNSSSKQNGSFKSSHVQVMEPAPLILGLVNDLYSLINKTHICGQLVLRHLEMHLQSIARKANLLSHLLHSEGNSLWNDRRRLVRILSCQPEDLALLYRLSYSNCQQRLLNGPSSACRDDELEFEEDVYSSFNHHTHHNNNTSNFNSLMNQNTKLVHSKSSTSTLQQLATKISITSNSSITKTNNSNLIINNTTTNSNTSTSSTSAGTTTSNPRRSPFTVTSSALNDYLILYDHNR